MATQRIGAETERWRELDARHHLHPFSDQAALAPAGLSRVFFANSGSEANDSVVKLVRYF